MGDTAAKIAINPDALYNLCAKCPDSKWVGDICRRLCGQEVELDFGQEQTFLVVRDACIIYAKRLDEMRERERKRKARYRERAYAAKAPQGVPVRPMDGTRKDGDSAGQDGTRRDETGVPRNYIINQSINQSVKEGKEKGGEKENGAQGALSPSLPKIPSLGDVLQFAADAATKPSGVAIPETFAREWHALMESGGWLNARGRTVLTNWRQALIYAYRREAQFAKERGNRRDGGGTQPEGQIYHEEGYENPL